MGLEAIYSTLTEHYPETYIDKLGRIPDGNLATADVGSIWAMLGAQDAIKMAGWTLTETQSEQTELLLARVAPGTLF